MSVLINIENVNKVYSNGFKALNDVSLQIQRGEILALLGPNGAGKTTLISTICGLVIPSSGTITVDGFDIIKDYRETRQRIGLVPQELTNNQFDTVKSTVQFTRGMFGKKPNNDLLKELLTDLSLWDKRDSLIMQLSGGMKRRVLIAKALIHEPQILFLDEPTAGVDVELRKDMWRLIHKLRERGVTIILTTHYIEEAEEIADRVGVINSGEILLVEDKDTLMQRLGKKELTLDLIEPLGSIPEMFSEFDLKLNSDGSSLLYTYDTKSDRTGISLLLQNLTEQGIRFNDLKTEQSSIEQIFIGLLNQPQVEEPTESRIEENVK
jgi:ABC-2 type transport system ATP-binding protein